MILSIAVIVVLAFVPMLFYVLILWWLDRYEKEPVGLLVMAFVWGALPSIILALIMQIALDIPLTLIQGSHQLTYELVGASLVAPITEEGVKALALIGLLLIWRREIDSPLDGLIYGGIVGFGFAAVENVFYFFGTYAESGMQDVFGLALLRAGIFGLNHAMYTGFTGLGVALSLEVTRKSLKPVPVVLGLGAAMTAHAMHNALTTLTSYTNLFVLLLTVLVDWGGIFVLLAIAIAALVVERHRIIAYTQTLADAGRIPAQEVRVLASPLKRNLTLLNRLLSGGVRQWWLLRRYYQEVSEAAFAWYRVKHGDARAQPRLARLENEIQRLVSSEGHL